MVQRNSPLKSVTVALVAVTVLLVVFSVLNLRQRASFQLPTDGVSWVRTEKGLMAWAVTANGPGARAGIERGDILLSINGRPVERTAQATQAIYQSGIWTSAHYHLERGSERFDATVIITPAKSRGSLADYLEIVGWLYLLIGAFVLGRRWSAPKALHFFLFCIASFVLYTFSYTGRLNGFDSAIYWLNVVAFVLQPAIFLHFCLTFPDRAPILRRHPSSVVLLYVPAAVLLAFHALVMTGIILLPFAGLPVRWLLDSLETLHMGLYLLAGAVAVAFAYHRAQEPDRRQQLKWVAGGILLSVVPFSVFYALPYFLGLGFLPAEWMKLSSLTLIFLPLTFAYAIVRYRLMDVEVIFRRGVAYALATAAVVGCYFGVVFLFAQFFRARDLITTETGWLVAIIITALLFQPLVNAIQGRMARFFNPERYNYRQTLLDFARELAAETHVEILLRQVVERLSATLNVGRLALFLAAEPGSFRLAESRGLPSDPALDLSFLSALEGEGAKSHLFFANPSRTTQVAEAHRASVAALGLHYYLPLEVRGRTLACLGLGRRRDGSYLSSEDVDLLRTIAGSIAMVLESAQLYESLERQANQVQALKDFSENIIASVDVGVVASNLGQRVESWNRAMESFYGLSARDAVGKRLADVFPPELLAELPSDSEPLKVTSRYKFQLSNARGDRRVVNLSTVPLLSKGQDVIGRLIILTDVTERVELEEHLMQAEKLSSIGMLAAGVAHEVNTPLAVIASQAQMLARQQPAEDPRGRTLDRIIKQAFRASEIVNSLLKFSRVSGSEHEEIDLNRVIRESLSLAEPMLRAAKISVNAQLHPDLPAVLGNYGKLQQVFMNLILNARDAMPHGGELTLSTERENSTVFAEVSDNGVGISGDDLRRIFDPFFTTKASSRGTGLGLSVTYGIIQEHSGKIQVESRPGLGASFRMEFPAARKPVHVS